MSRGVEARGRRRPLPWRDAKARHFWDVPARAAAPVGALAQLAVMGGEPLGEPLPDAPPPSSPCTAELWRLLSVKNGFYAFESALHVFPVGRARAGHTLEAWNADGLWRSAYGRKADGCVFFAEDVFGTQFCLRGEAVFAFDPETGFLEPVADTLDDWAEQVLAYYRALTGSEIAQAWQREKGPLWAGQRLIPKVPFACGGSLTLDNLDRVDAVEGMRVRAELSEYFAPCPQRG